MTKYNILLNQSNCTNINSYANQFRYNFPISATLKKGSKIAINQISLPYSMRNVTTAYGNNTLTVYIPSGSSGFTSYSITLNNGFYGVSDINTEIQRTLYANGLYWYSPLANATKINFPGKFSNSTTLVVDYGQQTGISIQLTVGMWIAFVNTIGVLTYTQITGLSTSSYWYYVTAVTNYPTSDVAMNAFTFNENSMSIIYPFSFSTYTPYYQNTLTSYTIPLSANVQSVFGYGYVPADGNFGTTAWSSYPTYSGACSYVVFPATSYYTMYGVNNNTTSTLGNLLGFYSSGTTQYPSTNTGLSVNSQTVYSNGLSQVPSFPPVGSNVNAIIVRCDISNNGGSSFYGDIIDNFPINATYGSTIKYTPFTDNSVDLREGTYNYLNITLLDQNLNQLVLLDYNVVISLCITIPD